MDHFSGRSSIASASALGGPSPWVSSTAMGFRISSSTSGPHVGVFLGNGNGTFQPPVNFPLPISWERGDRRGLFQWRRFSGPCGCHARAVFRCCWEMETGRSGRHCLLILGFRSFSLRKELSRWAISTAMAVKISWRPTLAGSVSVLLGNGDGTFRAPLIFNAGSRHFFSCRGRFQ